jgi:hypothetical protein
MKKLIPNEKRHSRSHGRQEAESGQRGSRCATSRRRCARPDQAGRDGSKTAKILDLLQRPGGTTLKELMKATGWLPHSLRGFLSGAVRKKMGLTVTSAKGEEEERTYSVEA